MTDDGRRVAETLGNGQEVYAHWGGTAKDVHACCRDEIEQLRKALALAVGELSTHAQYQYLSPEQLLNQFLTEAVRGE